MNFKNPEYDKKIEKASFDLRFLIERGYRKKSALNFVANRYLLDRKQRNYLVRTVFSSKKSMERWEKLVDINFISGNILFVDGYNVLITVESICSDKNSIVACDDGVLRDVNAVFGRYKISRWTEPALHYIISLLESYNPFLVKFIYDNPVSQSGDLAYLTNKIMRAYKIEGCAVTSKNTDFELVKLSNEFNGIVATSDSAVMDKVKKILDIPACCVNQENKKSEIKIKNKKR